MEFSMDCTEELLVEVPPANAALTDGAGRPCDAVGCFPTLCTSDSPMDGAAACNASFTFSAASVCPAGSPGVKPSCLSPAAKSPECGLLLSQLLSMFEGEAHGRPAIRPRYIEEVHRGYILPGYRRQIVDWMFEVGAEFALSRTSSFAAVQLFDRFLSSQAVQPTELQMLALTCIIIASKLHDTTPLRMGDVAKFFREVCSAAHVAQVEMVVLSRLGWDLHTTTILDFASRLCGLIPDAALADAVLTEACHFAVAAACDYDMLQFPVSEAGVSAFILAVRSVGAGGDLDAFLTAVQCRLPCLAAPSAACLHTMAELHSRCSSPQSVTSPVAKCLGLPSL